ncbi:sodium/calcium exchanger NCL2-like [Macadamia integrifolia]|uniref:sodium/calcium exchanger NCL2-like n=1 Tax=Macadamia integrifolia TaxID=60698 RepID=UPI001C4F3015|nr:sodium/calcium exchanger NCL2-like [Macadamia integrifolia]
MICRGVICLILLVPLFVGEGQSRPLINDISSSSSDDQLVSNGIDDHQSHPSPPFLYYHSDDNQPCERLFSFLPCTDTVETGLFLVALYGYMLFIGESHVTSGRESLYMIIGNGWYGSSLFHIFGVLPEATVILFSGLFKSKEEAQERVFTGVGLLAGSTITLLTLIWGTCILVARNDKTSSSTSNQSEASSPQNSQNGRQIRSFLTSCTVTTDKETSKLAAIMVLSMVPFIIVQLPEIFKSIPSGNTVILIALITSIAFLLSYFIYQEITPWIQMRKVEYVKQIYLVRDILKLIRAVDQDNDEAISITEFQEVLKGLKIGDMDTKKAIEKLMKEFDADGDNKIDETEFINGLKKMMETARNMVEDKYSAPEDLPDDKAYQEIWHEVETDELVEKNQTWTWIKAVLQLLFGMIILALLSEPLVDAVQGFSTAANIPPFFVAFVVVPLATNSREALSAISTASRKTPRTCSLTLSEIYSDISS